MFFLLDRQPPPPGTGNPSVQNLASESDEIATNEDISLHEVSFSYPTRPDFLALNRFSLKIKKGSLVALVGHSGCGSEFI